MKKPICLLLLFALLFPITVGAQTDVETQIRRVEHGLRPTVLIKGDQPWSLEERMKHWKVSLDAAKLDEFSGRFKVNPLELNPRNTHGGEMLKKLTANEQ